MCSSAQATVTKRQAGGWNNSLFSHSSGARESKLMVSTEVASGETPSWVAGGCLLRPHTGVPVCVCL